MSQKSSTLSPEVLCALRRRRTKMLKKIGTERYQTLMAKLTPHLRQLMTQLNCAHAIRAIPHALTQLRTDDPDMRELWTLVAAEIDLAA